jgi:putative ABC transport system permease protein
MAGFAKDQIPVFLSVPISTSQWIYDIGGDFDGIYILAESKDEVDSATSEAINILESRHNNKGKNVYTGEKLMKQVEQINRVIDIFTSFIGAVAAISLLVGGIGVMNIMLVSVTERTREIGIRKAIGATTNTILIQFLTESVIISLIGGVIGMIIGIAGAYAIGSLANVTPILSLNHILLVILFSTSVGVFFGIYPARKAAKLDPIDALRYE